MPEGKERWKGVALGLAILVPTGANAEERPEYFASLRLPSLVESDRSYVARPLNAPPDAPVVLHMRHLVLRLKAYEEGAKRWWPKREILLIRTALGRRWVAEDTFAPADFKRMEEPKPWLFLATSRPGARVERWSGGERIEDIMSGKTAPPESPCDGHWHYVYGRGGSTSFSFLELSTATVKAAIAEIRDGTFDPEEIDELVSFWGLLNPKVRKNETQRMALTAGLAWSTLLFDRREEGLKRPALVLFDDPEAPGSLDEWRSMTYLPHDLGVYVVPPDPSFP